MLEFLRPVEHFGVKFDRAMTLFEFSALREPEATQFPQIGAWLRAKGIEFNEVPMPQMLWRGQLWPDLYIANQLEAVPADFACSQHEYAAIPDKSAWPAEFSLASASLTNHGAQFHETFIEPLCRKISGRSSSEIAAKYHRAIWLPLYWPQTLRARASIRTQFHYPTGGYSGIVFDIIERDGARKDEKLLGDGICGRSSDGSVETVELQTAYVLAAPAREFSVIFVVDESPIYRITNQDACAGTVGNGFPRLIVEYRGECNVFLELVRLGIIDHSLPSKIAFGKMRMTLPTIANVAKGWRPRPHINDQLWSLMQ